MSSLSLSAVTLATVSGQEPQSVTILKGHVQSDAIHANDECPGEKKKTFFFLHVPKNDFYARAARFRLAFTIGFGM